MKQNRFVWNVSVNTLQLIVNQLFGLAIFYALSRGLNKNVFGQINWSLAILLTVFGVLTFGIDQVIVSKIAAGYNRQSLFSAYLFHVLISGSIFYALLLLFYLLFPSLAYQSLFLLFIGIGKLSIFFSGPFKQLATGIEKFGSLFFMAIASNIIRGCALLILLLMHDMTIRNVFFVFITGDISELVICMLVAKPLLQRPYIRQWNRRRQLLLLRQSLPQTGVVVFTAIMSRLDWILVGLLISSAKLAEYSFAYKIFEVSTLPLLIIAPIMIPLFTRLNQQHENLDKLSFFLEWQIIISCLIALLLNICWIPVIDFISDGKYGAVNSMTIFLLSLSMPLLYLSNYLWTIHFVKGNLKRVFVVMAVSLSVNIIGCSILIPIYKNEGAAIAYLITVLVQPLFYLQKRIIRIPAQSRYVLLLCPLLSIFSAIIAVKYFVHPLSSILAAIGIYIFGIAISGRLRAADWKTMQSPYQ